MSKFYSSLVVNAKKFPDVHQVFKPRYNKIYFKRLGDKIDAIESHLKQRCKNPQLDYSREKLTEFKANHQKLVKLNDSFENLLRNINKGDGEKLEKELARVGSQIEDLEDLVIPLTVNIPNRLSKLTPASDVVLEECKSDFLKRQNLFKILSHTKLSYINNCYSKSVVGPNSYYYRGIAAKLQQGLMEYFESQLSRDGKIFAPLSGGCLVKSAVIEACNMKTSKDFYHDPGRILTDQPAYTTLHLVEASREALLAFITTLHPSSSNEPIRLVTRGAGYRTGSDWFDSDTKRISQFETIHALALCNSIETYSMREYHRIVGIIWESYKALELPVRLVHCSNNSMNENEYDAHRIDVWLPSLSDWLQVSRVSHYLDFISVRSGMKRGHIVDSMVFCGQTLTAAILENRQTCLGKFVIPAEIVEHMPYLSESERADYFTIPDNTNHNDKNDLDSSVGRPMKGPLNNYEQRRYLVRKNYGFSHSKRAEEQLTRGGLRLVILPFAAVGLIIMLVDWVEFFRCNLREGFRRPLYDYIYRPYRRVCNWVLFRNDPEVYELKKLENSVPYDEVSVFKEDRDFRARRKERWYQTLEQFDRVKPSKDTKSETSEEKGKVAD